MTPSLLKSHLDNKMLVLVGSYIDGYEGTYVKQLSEKKEHTQSM